MDRTLVLPGAVAIPVGHRVEVTEREPAEPDGEGLAVSLLDLETGIRYQRSESGTPGARTWIGRVLSCTLTLTAGGGRTVLLVDPVDEGASAAGIALRGADAAADAAKAEADRWGGADRAPWQEPKRVW